MPTPVYDNDSDFSGLLDSLSHEGKLAGLDRETRRRFKDWLWEYFRKTRPADTKAWAFLKHLSRLEDRDAIEDGADPNEVYARNEFIPAEVVRRLRNSVDFQKAIDDAERRWEEVEISRQIHLIFMKNRNPVISSRLQWYRS